MASVAIPRVSDNYLLRAFVNETLLKHEDLELSKQARISLRISQNSFNINLEDIGEDGSLTDEFLESIRVEAKYSCSIGSISIIDPMLQHSTISYTRNADGFIDRIKTVDNQQLPIPSLKLFIHIETQLQMSISPQTIGETQSDVFAAHHEVLTKLEGLNASLIDKQQERFNSLQNEKSQFIIDKTDEFSKKNAALEEAYLKKGQDLTDKYDKRNQELDERAKQIEDADNTTARRKTTTSMLEEVHVKAKQFNFSSSVTLRSLWAIIFAFLLLAVGAWSAISSVNELQKLNSSSTMGTNLVSEINKTDTSKLYKNAQVPNVNDSTYIWFLYIRVFLSSALFVSSTIYLIKWFNSWANRIAQQELENQQFVRDLNRAHLAVEMCLEWNDKKDGDIPERLLESLTEGLFQDKNQVPQDIAHPAEQLASALIRSSDKLRLPIGTGDLEINGKKLSKVKSPKNLPAKAVNE